MKKLIAILLLVSATAFGQGLDGQLSAGMPLGPGDSLHGLAGTGAVVTYTLLGVEASLSSQPRVFQNHVLAQGQLGTGDASIYSPPSRTTAAVSQVILTNTSGSAVSGVSLGINGSSATAGNQILASISIPANGLALLIDGILRVYDANGNLYQTATTPFDATAPAATTPLALGTVGTAVTAPHRDHTHQSPGGVASTVAASSGINTTETQVVGATIPAGMLKAGSVIEIEAYGTITSTVDNVATFNIRLGPTTLTGNIPAALAVHCGNSGTVTNAAFVLRARMHVRTAGASGTVYGYGTVISLDSGAAVTQALALTTELFTPASVALDTTVANVGELTVVTAATTTTITFQAASASVIKM